MSSIFGVAMLLLFGVALISALKADKHYRHMNTLGQQDYIRHRDQSEKYKGLELWSYSRGRQKQATIHGEKPVLDCDQHTD